MSKIIVGVYPQLEPNKDYHYYPFSLLKVGSLIEKTTDNFFDIIDERVVEDVYREINMYNSGEQEFYFSVYAGYQVTRANDLTDYILDKNKKAKITWGGPFVESFLNDGGVFPKHIKKITGYYEGEAWNHVEINWDLVQLNKYISPKKRFMYITSYGCPGNCTFCANIKKRKWKEIPINIVEADINNLMKKYDFKECVIFDATMFTRGHRANDIADILNKHNLEWIADARADEILRMHKKDLNQIMKKGLKQLTIGLETGSDKIAKRMNKMKDNLKVYQNCIKKLSNYNIDVASGAIFGVPGETIQDLKETISYYKKMLKINKNLKLSTTFFMPLPNTQMAIEAEAEGWKRPKTIKEWAEYGEESHFKYNEWMDNPWIKQKEEYKKIYDEFIQENKERIL
jgi:radical SAM superfamily enzyme YgiQ (UPF0313 family)